MFVSCLVAQSERTQRSFVKELMQNQISYSTNEDSKQECWELELSLSKRPSNHRRKAIHVYV